MRLETLVFEIVARVDGKGDLPGTQHLGQTKGQLGAANTAGQGEPVLQAPIT